MSLDTIKYLPSVRHRYFASEWKLVLPERSVRTNNPVDFGHTQGRGTLFPYDAISSYRVTVLQFF